MSLTPARVNPRLRGHLRILVCALACATGGLMASHAQEHPVVKVRELPDGLRAQWNQTRPDMLSTSRCAAAFDNHSDPERMTLQCSIYIKLGAEGARRAMRYCEQERQKRHIQAPCRIVLGE